MCKVLANRSVSRLGFPLNLAAAGKIGFKEGSCVRGDVVQSEGRNVWGKRAGGRGLPTPPPPNPMPGHGLGERRDLPKKPSSQEGKKKKKQRTERDINHLAEISNKYRGGQKAHLESSKIDIYSAGVLGEMRAKFPYLYNSLCLLLEKSVLLLVRCFRWSYR